MDIDDHTLKPETNPDEFTTYTLPSGDRLSEAIVRAVAIETGCDPLELPPLYETVDPDALDELWNSETGSGANVVLSFPYASYDVWITRDTIRLREQ